MFQGMPLHPLLVHFGIVLLLLTAGAQLLAVAVPRFRRWLGWGLPLAGVASAVIVRVTVSYGEILFEQRYGESATGVIADHGVWGSRAGVAAILLGLLTVLFWAVTSETGRARWTGRWPSWVTPLVSGLAALAAVWAMVAVTLAGHTGATSVWGG